MDVKDVLADALRASGLNQSELANKIKVKRQAVSKWLNGTNLPSRENAIKLADALNIPLSAIGPDPDTINVKPVAITQHFSEVPKIDWVSAGRGAQPADPYPAGDGSEILRVDFPVSESTFGLEIQGDSMLPEFREGDVIIIDPQVPPRPNDYVVARIDDQEECTFKRYAPRGTSSDGTPVFDLVPLNPECQTITVNSANPGSIVGTMVEHRRRRVP